jgi:SAM-dependent methyltransferase
MTDFYEKNHNEYFKTTVKIDPSSFLAPLTRFLHREATILDIGCGSGRDLLWFRKHGFYPTGFEQSAGLARLAAQHSSCPVIEGDYQTYDFSTLSFDALLFIGSLVHLPREMLAPVIETTRRALNRNGHILLTLKKGKGTSQAADGRVFTLWSQDELVKLFLSCGLVPVDFSQVVSKLRKEDIWLGFVLKQING